MVRILIVALLVLGALTQVAPPVWPNVFHQTFVQSYNHTRLHTSGRFYFDADREAMRVDRTDGQSDMVCNSILPNVSTACTQLIANKKRYIVFPERRSCCMCCDAAHGCGVLRRDWLSTATYIGEETLSGESFYKWSIPDGAATDLYYARKDDQRTPRRLVTGTTAVQDFIMNTFSTDPLDASVFAVPSYCTSTCPATTVCGKFQAVSQM